MLGIAELVVETGALHDHGDLLCIPVLRDQCLLDAPALAHERGQPAILEAEAENRTGHCARDPEEQQADREVDVRRRSFGAWLAVDEVRRVANLPTGEDSEAAHCAAAEEQHQHDERLLELGDGIAACDLRQLPESGETHDGDPEAAGPDK